MPRSRWLTPRLAKVLRLKALGKCDKDIANELGYSNSTIKSYLNIIRKFAISSGEGNHNAAILVAIALRENCITIDELLSLVPYYMSKILAKTKFCYLWSRQEGYGLPNAIPTLRNNPGDLRHSPHSWHPNDDPECIGYIDTIEHGWEDIERQAGIYAEIGLTIGETINVICGLPKDAKHDMNNPDHNNVVAYVKFVTQGMEMSEDTLLSEALKVPYVP